MDRTVMFCTFLALCAAFADDPYADYVKLTRTDDKNNSSWNAVGGWSDGREPHSDTNYYVSGTLYRIHNLTDTNRFWNGGQLVIAGVFYSAVSSGDKYGPYIPDLVLLPGAHVQTECYGPIYVSPYDSSVYGTVTVKGTAENPSRISQYYKESFTSSGSARSHSLMAKFHGTADSYLTFTRPMKNGNTVLERGFYCRAEAATFADYPGTFKVFGSNTIFRLNAANAFNWPNTAFIAEDGVDLALYYNDTYNNSTKNTYFRSFKATGAKVAFNYNSTANATFPVVNVTDSFVCDGGTAVRIANATVDKFIGGMTADDPSGKALKLAHLTGTAAANVGDLTDVSLRGSGDLPPPVTNVTLLAVDAGGGAKDVYIASPGIVTMTNANIETTGASGTQYSAFAAGHAGDWSNLETPPSNSTLHYWGKQKICFFQNTELPNATLTIGANSSWKAGSRLTFKEVNMLAGLSFGLWSSNSQRTLTAERMNIWKRSAAVESATIYVFASLTLNINADLCGNGNLLIRNNSDQAGTVALSHINTNFHGRLIVQQTSDWKTKYRFTAILNDARNFGGAYTMSTNTYNAITFDYFPKLSVTNDATFVEPTRNMLINRGVQFTVNAGKTLTLANQVTYAGELVKAGAGTLELAGTTRFINGAEATAPVATTNMLTVSAGALKVSAKDAAKGLAVSFAEGTKLIIPADSEYGYCNTLWDAPLTIDTTSGKLPVEVEMTGNEGTGDITVPICTFNATAAAGIPETAFAVKNMANGFRPKASVTKRTNGDGSVTYLATLGRFGTQFLIR